MQTLDYQGRTVVITGAASGIGLGLAQAFAEQGARLELVDRNAPALAAVVEQLSALTQVHGRVLDLNDDDAVADYASRLGQRQSQVDVLINNAGMEQPTPLQDAAADANRRWQLQLDNNVVSMLRLTRALLPLLGNGSSVINQSSIWGLSAVAGFSAYVASKHAVIGLTRSLAWELGAQGIRVNAVCPGWVGTEAAMASLRNMAQGSGRSEAEELEHILAAQAIPELLTPADLAGTFLFLGAPASAAITGQAIVVSRGEVMH
ncbi:MAG TPA: NAD(P)-dependent oxidoreductase [Pseudomonas sp.]|nr:3-hydroxybutyrate dehydrogenase [Pseudomonas sp.]MBB50087.1 3-hydroxybutyrate dehydrogenase [Pseudomonadales bacterium]MBF77662.1 3-hydroxybutyrate dehydrogenase [Pseudomonadales bacterium]HCA23070.1 NAD(P)-dependent oxidoreductase [Pseudomonas sp.]